MNVLAIAGHADDIELGLGGTIAKHTKQGDTVYALIITPSGYKSYDGTVIREEAVAHDEAERGAKILGIRQIFWFSYETKRVEYNVDLIEDINRLIDNLPSRPDIIYTHWSGDINQDHSAIGKATLVAARNIPRILMYRSNWYKSDQVFNGNFYVDISEYIETKITSIKAHQSEIEKRGDIWIEFIKNENRNCGIMLGVNYAEPFEVIKWMA